MAHVLDEAIYRYMAFAMAETFQALGEIDPTWKVQAVASNLRLQPIVSRSQKTGAVATLWL